MKLHKKTMIFWLLAAAPTIVALISLPFIADKLPTAYNFSGGITAWGSRYTILTLPIVAFVMSAVTFVCLYVINRMCEVKIKESLLSKAYLGVAVVMNIIAYAVMAMTIVKS